MHPFKEHIYKVPKDQQIVSRYPYWIELNSSHYVLCVPFTHLSIILQFSSPLYPQERKKYANSQTQSLKKTHPEIMYPQMNVQKKNLHNHPLFTILILLNWFSCLILSIVLRSAHSRRSFFTMGLCDEIGIMIVNKTQRIIVL